MRASKPGSVTRKVNLIILTSLFIGLGGVVFYFALSLSITIQNSTRESLDEQSGVIYTAIENFMLPGEAPLAVQYFTELQRRSPLSSIYLFRLDGTQAFTDSSTIREVNTMISGRQFSAPPRSTIEPLTRNDAMFAAATELPPETGTFQTNEEGKTFFHIYKPLINKPKCTRCHGADHTIRGVLEIKTDISASVRQREKTVLVSSGIFLGVLILLSLLLTRFMHRTVISPVRDIGDVCRAVTGGNFSQKVAVNSKDEIGELGSTVNTMVDGLYERYALSKFVSNSTIQSLRKEGEGEEISLTLLFSDIRGFTSYSEPRRPEEVVQKLNELLNMQSKIISQNNGDIDKFVGDEVVAIFTGPDGPVSACRSALEIQSELSRSTDRFDHLQVGIGIHTGKVIMGMIGSQNRADYTVIGDNVNTASRLCGSAKPQEILLSLSTGRAIRSIARLEGPFKLRVKGKQNYVGVYKLKEMQA
jgi:adenylate cyclase